MPHLEIVTYSSQLFWLTILFIAIYVFISGFFIPKVEATLIKRNKDIENYISQSEELLEKCQEIESQMKSEYNETRVIALHIRHQSLEENKRLEEDRTKMIEEKLRNEYNKSVSQVEKNKNKVVEDLLGHKKEIVDLLLQKICGNSA